MEDCANETADQQKRSRKRAWIKGHVKSTLEQHFTMEKKPSPQTIAKLADSLRMKKNVVRIWFCNQRYKEKSIKPLAESNIVPPATSTSSQIPAEMKDSVDNNLSSSVQSPESNGIDCDQKEATTETVELPGVESIVGSSDSCNKRTMVEGSFKDALEKHFSMEPKPSQEVIASLAHSLQLKEKTVHTWFAKRRHKEKFNKRLTPLKTSSIKTRLSTTRIPTSDDLVGDRTTTETIQQASGSTEMSDLDPLRLSPLANDENSELSPMECSLESSMSSGTPKDIRFTSRPCLPTKKRMLIEGAIKETLEKHFFTEPKPSLEVIASLADSLQLSAEVVRVWFANRRHKEKCRKPIAKQQSTRQERRIDESGSPIPNSCPIADETFETAEDHVDSANENSSSTVVELPEVESTFTPPISSNSILSSESPSVIGRPSGSALRNGKPWGPLSRRRPLAEENRIELVERIAETPSAAPLESTKKIRFAERLIKRSTAIGRENGMDIYAVPLIKSTGSSSQTFERFSFGNPNEQRAERRTVLFLGASASGVAKFINGIINFIFNVEQSDNYRFQLIDEKEFGQTNCIKVYDVHHSGGFRVTYSLTLVAVPSYDVNNTEDSLLFRDQNLATMMLGLLENDGGIDELNMICNVVTETVFNQSFMSIFGKDLAGSLGNWQQPFNYLGDTSSWQEVIQRFVVALSSIPTTKSLSLTKQVLRERKKMEETTNALESLVKFGTNKKKEMDKAKQMIVFCESQIQSTEDGGCFVVETKKKVQLKDGECVYNCNSCCVTCHDSLVKEENEKDVYESTMAGFCSVCPDQCNLSQHSNQPYRWESVKKATRRSPVDRSQIRNDAEMKWKDIKSKSRDLIEGLEKDLADNGKDMLEQFVATWRCIQRMNKIALNGNSFLTRRVFDVLYNAERQLKELGLEEGLTSLRN